MFSLLITLIAIALVAALALATLYYGGPVFNQGAEAAHAARIDSQSQQIMGAMGLYNAEVGHYPVVLEDLVSANYLKSIPVAQAAQAVSVAIASTTTWLMAASGNPVVVTQQVPVATCMAFNKLNLGQNAVLATVHSNALRQCYGTDPANLTILVAKSGADTVNVAGNASAVVQIGTVLDTPVPALTDTSANGWSILPSTPAPAPTPLTLGYSQNGSAISSVLFADTAVGATSQSQTVTVTNNGAAPVVFSGVTTSVPFLGTVNTCVGTLAVGGNCSVTVSFAPTAAIPYAGAAYSLTFNTTQGTSSSLGLSGTGVTPSAPVSEILMFSDGAAQTYSVWDFGRVVPGYPGVSTDYTLGYSTVSVTNISQSAQTVTAANVTAPFAIDVDTCTGVTLAPGDSCYFEGNIDASQAQIYNATLTVSLASGAPVTLPVTANATAVLAFSPAPLVFPTTALYSGSYPTLPVTVTNTSSYPVTLGAVQDVGYVNRNEFSWKQKSCASNPLAPGESCTFMTATYHPQLLWVNGSGQAPGQESFALGLVYTLEDGQGLMHMAIVGMQATGTCTLAGPPSPAQQCAY